MHVARLQIGDHRGGIGESVDRRIEVHVAPADQRARTRPDRPVDPHPGGRHLKCLELVGVSLDQCLRVGDAVRSEIGVVIVAPEDRIEGPVRRHQGAVRQRVVPLENVGRRRAVDHVVGQLGRIEIETRMPADADRVAAEGQRVGVDAILARRPIERCATRRIAAARRRIGEAQRIAVVRAAVVEGAVAPPVRKLPDTVVALAPVDELLLDVRRRAVAVAQLHLDDFGGHEGEAHMRRVGRSGKHERRIQCRRRLAGDRRAVGDRYGPNGERRLRFSNQDGAGRLLDDRVRIRRCRDFEAQRRRFQHGVRCQRSSNERQ